MGANFGRDADTIATMTGGLAGALRGIAAFPPDWVEHGLQDAGATYPDLAVQLVGVIMRRRDEAAAHVALLERLLAEP